MRLADRVIYLTDGTVVHDGNPDQVLPLILDAA
jgi:ABC-type branched-subunit amino acid transport system ATPase component